MGDPTTISISVTASTLVNISSRYKVKQVERRGKERKGPTEATIPLALGGKGKVLDTSGEEWGQPKTPGEQDFTGAMERGKLVGWKDVSGDLLVKLPLSHKWVWRGVGGKWLIP